ncbi:MAG: 2OG-Fe dioxygenase family protein [Burkholderiaceae bacterium]|uniref:2OG-Fe dioxygenase family protein n=1 Tax=Hydrogenophaga sp. TaxID=1904254 RepID=UPI00271FE75A|nr:2OG-Fe dioxygenase family protein [Hydrogenophaga sp.]MDO8277869.1 2OG-Fe dioxygenase family protein [Burkholderiaceae bacterium]MDO9030933.1 2OG-Fe dioxygenase family protein [Hydrogenophaga sp.]
MSLPSAPFVPVDRLTPLLREQGYAVLAPPALAELARCALVDFDVLKPGWDRLPADTYLRDGGRYRRRRHSCFVIEDGRLRQAAHRAHWQPVEYNALHGGMQRWFEPVEPATVAQPAWSALLLSLAGVCSALKGAQTWYVEAHQFRIDTTDGIGRPTPEGAHRDGVDFVAVVLVDRVDVKGGETRVFEADGPSGQRFTLDQSWSLLMLDDERVIHESTPIQPVAEAGHRDTLVLTFRRAGFQGD